MSRSDRKSRKQKAAAGGAPAVPTTGEDARQVMLATARAEEPAAPTIVTRDLARDIATIDAAEWPHRDWPLPAATRGAGFQVVVKRSVLNAINRHGQSTSDVEVCGVLVGNVCRDAAGPFLHVEAAIRGDFAGNSAAQVTFTAETWNHIQGVMEKDHPEQRIVGWYHTHPGFGIFLSDMDLFIHGNFFNLPWQVAFVYDPSSGEEGMFIWRQGKAERADFSVEEDVEKDLVTMPVSAEISAAALADFSRRMQRMEQRQRAVVVAMPFVILIALAWPFVLFTILADRSGSGQPARGGPAKPETKLTELAPAAAATERSAVSAATVPAAAPTTVNLVEAPSAAPTTQAATSQALGTPPETKPAEVIRPGPATSHVGPKVLEPPGERQGQ